MSVLMPPLKLRRKIMVDQSVPENHVLAAMEAAQVFVFIIYSFPPLHLKLAR